MKPSQIKTLREELEKLIEKNFTCDEMKDQLISGDWEIMHRLSFVCQTLKSLEFTRMEFDKRQESLKW